MRGVLRSWWVRAIPAALLLHVLLLQPHRPSALAPAAFLKIPLELPVILLTLLALGNGRAGRALRVALAVALTLLFVLRSADLAMYTAHGRSFDPVADITLVDALLRLLAGAIGTPETVAVAIGALLLILAVALGIWWATGVWARAASAVPLRPAVPALAAICAVAVVAETGDARDAWTLPADPPGEAFAARYAARSIAEARNSVADLRAFARAAREDPFARATDLLGAIDRDVLLVFIESYGRTSLDTPFYADTHRATLETQTARLREAGLAMRSGYLSAPTVGGGSWLSHMTFATGLWINSQSRYRAALASGRETLFHIARRSGFRTATVAPAITLDWPEAEKMGFDRILAASDLGYRGKPFNWVTMPDQYTLTALDRLLRGGGHDKPLFAEIALISSHAPWVPVPDLLDWDDIGDGRIFDEVATSGDPPKIVWQDRDRVRAQYRKAIDYALRTVFDYARLHADDPPLMIVLGDHQTAASISLDERTDVPIHVIGPSALVDRVAAWGWAEGLLPAADPAVPMNLMREMILHAFSDVRVSGMTE